jgi:hypothetical protein
MNLPFVVFDVALGTLALRSLAVVQTKAPWTSAGWAGTLGYCATAAVAFSRNVPPLGFMLWADAFLVLAAGSWVTAAIKREPHAEPWWWPVRLDATGAPKR